MGFRKINQFKVQTLLIECIDDWTLALDEKKSVDIIFFDFHKAFDTINIDILLQKLNRAGLTGDCLSWLKDFISFKQNLLGKN
jgi:hypothetical protein